jgi:hypothetical protein
MSTSTPRKGLLNRKDIVISLVFGGIITLLFASGIIYMMGQSKISNGNYTKAYASGPSNTAPVTTNATPATLTTGTSIVYGLQTNVSDVDSNIDLNAFDLDPATVGQQTTLIVSGKGTFSIATNGTGQLTFTRDSTFFSGSATINYTISDTLLAVSNVSTITVSVAISDVTPPTVSLATSSTSITANGTFVLTATAADNVGVTKVDINDNVTPGTPYTTITTSPYTVTSIALTSANNGTYIYTAKAFDAAANSTVSNSVTVVVNIPVVVGDTIPPTITPKTATTVGTTPVTVNVITGSADNVGGSGVNSASVVISSPVNATFVVNTSGIVTVTPTCSAPCTATANYTVKDASANVSIASTITVTVTAPTVSTDIDSDGVTNAIEDTGPNNGDADGSGVKDSLEPLVTTLPSVDSTKYVSVKLTSPQGSNCTKVSIAKIQRSTDLVLADSLNTYPYGLLNFEAQCDQVDVTIDWYVNTASDIKYRKLVYSTPGTTSTAQYIDYLNTVTKFTKYGITGYRSQFTLKDGLVGDLTGVDGKIVDPSGIAVTTTAIVAPDLVRTGSNGVAAATIMISTFLILALSYFGITHSSMFKKIN